MNALVTVYIGSQGVFRSLGIPASPFNKICYKYVINLIKEEKLGNSYHQVLINKFPCCQCMLIFNVCIVAVTTIVSQDFVLIFIFVHF